MTDRPTLLKRIQEAASYLESELGAFRPEVGIILGSGLGKLAEDVEQSKSFSYSEIPHFKKTSVSGHLGKLVFGLSQGVPVGFLEGRLHLYEGHTPEDVVFPLRVLICLGIQSVILTNAAGAVNAHYRPGDLMLIEDHINLLGTNPLIGPPSSGITELGPRFLDQKEVYHADFLKLFRTIASDLQMTVHSGVYAGLMGPSYETPAEVRMLRALGADAVGMSTVCEATAAHHQGVRVIGLSSISNMATGLSSHQLTHSEVLENADHSAKQIKLLIQKALPGLIAKKGSS